MNYTLIALFASLSINIVMFFVVASLLDYRARVRGDDDSDWPVGV